MAGGGRVEHDQVGGARLLEALHLAEHEDVLHAGNGRRDHVERARRREPLRDPLQAVAFEVFEERGVGRECAGRDAVVELGFVVGERGRSNAAASPDLPSTSTMSTLMPVRAAATASAAVTVVLPTPPLPATITTRDVEQNCASSIPCMLREC